MTKIITDQPTLPCENEISTVDSIRLKLIEAEENGFTDQSPEEILKLIKNGLGQI